MRKFKFLNKVLLLQTNIFHLQLQATLQRDLPEPEVPEKDDVDLLLDELVCHYFESWIL